MASLSRSGDGRSSIQFIDTDNRRRTIRLGKVDKRTAEAVKLRVEALLNAKITNTPVDRDTAVWLTGIGSDLADKLASVGLTAPRASRLLGEFIAEYIDARTDVATNTIICLQGGAKRLLAFFDAKRPLESITPADMDRWFIWLQSKGYAAATIGRTIRRASQFFRAAVRGRLLTYNPVAGIKAPSQVNESRKRFIDHTTIQKVIDACPDAEWRLIVALCRYGGIRCPSELLPLTWNDVNWERNRFLVSSPKTGDRWVPLFPELLPRFAECFEQAEPGTIYCIAKRRGSAQALFSQFKKIIKRAGVEPWIKPFHNLRASRETELAATFPLHVVCKWLGNSALIAQKHYLQVTDADYARAALSGAFDPEALQKAIQSVQNSVGQEETQPHDPVSVSPFLPSAVPNGPSVQVDRRGIEPLFSA